MGRDKQRQRDKNRTGRRTAAIPSTEPGGFTRVELEMQKSHAFQGLSAAALRVLLLAKFLNYAATTTNGNGTGKGTGKNNGTGAGAGSGAGSLARSFRMTNATAKEILGMHQQTFSRAKDELAAAGFLKWTRRGGLAGCNGVASEFALSSDWKQATKQTPKKQTPSHPVVTGGSHPVVTGFKSKSAGNLKTCHPVVTGSDQKAVTTG